MDDPFVKEKSNPKQFLVTKRQKKQAIKGVNHVREIYTLQLLSILLRQSQGSKGTFFISAEITNQQTWT